MPRSELLDAPPAPATQPTEPEVLIREARRRARRRRMGWAAALGLMLMGVLAGLIATRGTSRRPVPVTPSSPLTVDARAFHGHGVLAFVSKGSLYVLDGGNGRLVHLADPGRTASDPVLSPDGRWLAYLEASGQSGFEAAVSPHGGGDGAYQLWISRAEGTQARRVHEPRNMELVGWSPAGDDLAVIERPPPSWSCASRSPAAYGVLLVTPPATVRRLYSLPASCANPDAVYGAVWSPDGTAIAIATTHFKRSGGSRIFVIDPATGYRRTWFAIRNSQTLPGICHGCAARDVIPALAGWWPRRGIGFWVFSNGMTHDTDGSPLELVGAPGARPAKLGMTLSDGTDTPVAVSRSGALAIVSAPDRDVGTGGTQVQICASRAVTCPAVPRASVWDRPARFTCHAHHPYLYCYPPLKPGAPSSGVSLDPAWSPSGSLLAYVRGPAVPQSATATGQWLDQHQLFLYNPATHKARALPKTQGASAPQWSADGGSILYVAHDSLWLLALKSGRSTRIAGPLFGGTSFTAAYNANTFYHQVPFTAQFGWRS